MLILRLCDDSTLIDTLTSFLMVAIQTKLRIPPAARHGTSIYPLKGFATYLFILLVLHGVLFERLISDSLQIVHKGL